MARKLRSQVGMLDKGTKGEARTCDVPFGMLCTISPPSPFGAIFSTARAAHAQLSKDWRFQLCDQQSKSPLTPVRQRFVQVATHFCSQDCVGGTVGGEGVGLAVGAVDGRGVGEGVGIAVGAVVGRGVGGATQFQSHMPQKSSSHHV